MKEELVTFETAKLAKEKGFEEETYYCYNSDKELEQAIDFTGNFTFDSKDIINAKDNDFEAYLAPTQSLLQKWLRQIHGIETIVKSWEHEEKIIFLYSVQKLTKPSTYRFDKGADTYEQALEAGLQEALKLIR